MWILTEKLMRHHAHGMAEIEFTEVIAAVHCMEIVNPDRPYVLAYEVGLQPVLNFLLIGKSELNPVADSLIGQKEISSIHAIGSGEKGETPKLRLVAQDHIFKGEFLRHLSAGFGDDTALLLHHFLQPADIESVHLVGHPSDSASRTRPWGFQHQLRMDDKHGLNL